jgi:hypothetical protein
MLVERRMIKTGSSLTVFGMLWYMKNIISIAAGGAYLVFILVSQN